MKADTAEQQIVNAVNGIFTALTAEDIAKRASLLHIATDLGPERLPLRRN